MTGFTKGKLQREKKKKQKSLPQFALQNHPTACFCVSLFDCSSELQLFFSEHQLKIKALEDIFSYILWIFLRLRNKLKEFSHVIFFLLFLFACK